MHFKDSSVVLITVGSTIRASVTCPASIDTPTLRYRTINANPKRPNTIDGVPFRRSTPVRISFVIRPSRVYSTRYIAAPTPSGRAMAIAPTTRYRVPIMAGKIPPDRPESSGGFVRNSHESAGRPLMTISCRIMTRIARTTSVAPKMNPNAIVWIWFSDK